MIFKQLTKSLQPLLAIFILLLSFSNNALASGFSIEKASANFDQTELSVSAKFELDLSDTIDEALHNGVTIKLLTTLDLYSRRKLLWDEHIAQWAFSHEISYHSLTRSYILSSPQTTETLSFSSLSSLLSQIEIFSFQSDILGDTLPPSKAGYVLQLRIFLDKSALPTPLRVMTYISPAWKAKSKVYEWTVER